MTSRITTAIFALVLFATQTLGRPEVQFEPDPVNLGLVDRAGATVRRSVKVHNLGDEPLQLKVVGTSCGCTSVVSYDEVVPAKGIGELRIQIDPSSAKPGPAQQQILFATNIAGRERVVLNVVYQLRSSPVTVSPTEFMLQLSPGDLARPATAKQSIFILDSWDKRLEVSEISTSPHVAACMYDTIYQCPKGSRLHVVRIDVQLMEDLPAGSLSEFVRFTTNCPDLPVMTVPIKGVLKGAADVSPRTLLFTPPQPGESERREIQVTPVGGADRVDVAVVKPSVPWLHVERLPTSGQAEIRFGVSVDRAAIRTEESSRVLRATIEIELKSKTKWIERVEVILTR